MAVKKILYYKDVSIVMISINEEGAIRNVLQDISKGGYSLDLPALTQKLNL